MTRETNGKNPYLRFSMQSKSCWQANPCNILGNLNGFSWAHWRPVGVIKKEVNVAPSFSTRPWCSQFFWQNFWRCRRCCCSSSDSPRLSRMDRNVRSVSQPRGKRDSSVSSAYAGGIVPLGTQTLGLFTRPISVCDFVTRCSFRLLLLVETTLE